MEQALPQGAGCGLALAVGADLRLDPGELLLDLAHDRGVGKAGSAPLASNVSVPRSSKMVRRGLVWASGTKASEISKYFRWSVF